MNIHKIKHEDENVKRAVELLGHSLKYICETNRRRKDNKTYALSYYAAYMAAYDKLSDSAPNEFLLALIGDKKSDLDVDSIAKELLEAIARYLSKKTGKPVTISFLPFYFNDSFENFNGWKFGEYVRDHLMGNKLRYTATELREMTITITSLACDTAKEAHADVLDVEEKR